MLELTEFGQEWSGSGAFNKPLQLKAIGLMFAFFKRKDQTPRGGTISRAAASFKFVCDNNNLKRFLYEVRNVLAAVNSVPPFQVLKDAAIERMVRLKPISNEEFSLHRYDGFNADKLLRYAPTIVKAIAKYMVRNPQHAYRSVIAF